MCVEMFDDWCEFMLPGGLVTVCVSQCVLFIKVDPPFSFLFLL